MLNGSSSGGIAREGHAMVNTLKCKLFYIPWFKTTVAITTSLNSNVGYSAHVKMIT